MLDLLGRYYVIEHVLAEHKNKTEEYVYRSYMSDILKAIVEINGAEINVRYVDIITKAPEDDRTGDEIALDIINRLNE